MNSQTYCKMPHIGLAVQNNGDFCACNLSKDSLQTAEHRVMFMHRDQLADAWTSHTRTKLAQELDSGHRAAGCVACFSVEDAGGSSLRRMMNAKHRHLEPRTDQPQVLILKPGNTCNLSCRTCNAETSSGWYRDEYELQKLQGYTGTLHEYTQRFEHIRQSFNRDNRDFWDTFVRWMPGIAELNIYGGEPMLMPALFDSLKCVENKTAHIYLHTNGTVFNQEYLETLRGYRRVNLNISIDSDNPEEFEYIRYPAKAESVFANVDAYRKFFNGHSNVRLEITVTVSTLNVANIDRIEHNLRQRFQLPVLPNFVTEPRGYDIRNIPDKNQLLIKNSVVRRFLTQPATDADAYAQYVLHSQQLDHIRNMVPPVGFEPTTCANLAP